MCQETIDESLDVAQLLPLQFSSVQRNYSLRAEAVPIGRSLFIVSNALSPLLQLFCQRTTLLPWLATPHSHDGFQLHAFYNTLETVRIMSGAYKSGSGSLPSPKRTPAEPLSCPYVPGATFTAHRHQPPAPFGAYCSRCELPKQKDLQRTTQLDWYLAHPPADGCTSFDDTCSFTVTSGIRTGENLGAQLVLTDTGLVAKIYDPLFYSF